MAMKDIARLLDIPDKLDALVERIDRLIHVTQVQGHIIMANIQDIKDAVARESEVEASVVTLLHHISQMLKDAIAAGDPQAMSDVVTMLDKNSQSLSDAVLENTPVYP